MSGPVHVSKARIIPEKHFVKQAYVSPLPTPIRTGVHGGVKAWYKAQVDEELPTTLDHVVAAAEEQLDVAERWIREQTMAAGYPWQSRRPEPVAASSARRDDLSSLQPILSA